MIRQLGQTTYDETCFQGLRMSTEEYLALGETQIRYELIDGVVIMSPSPTAQHQELIMEIAYQVAAFLDESQIGRVFPELDINLRVALDREVVYRPDVVYVSKEQAGIIKTHITAAPDVVVEVVSPHSRQYDSVTKKNDYEAAGVREYWLIDPLEAKMTFFVRQGEKFVESIPQTDTFASTAISGFTLNLGRIRRLFKPEA